MVRYLIVIHRAGKGKWLAYDILCKAGWFDRLLDRLGVRKIYVPDEYEYDIDCSIARKFIEEGWEYLGSGDTAHIDSFFRERGIKGEDDLEGLKRWLLSRFPGAEVVVHG